MDASPFLGLLADGGTQHFRIEMGPGWERGTERDAAISLRLSTKGERLRSKGVQYAWGGGAFDANYATAHAPLSFSVPEEATRVELVLLLSGHGQSDGDNCAEWCDHRHAFSINGQPLLEVRSELAIGDRLACAVEAMNGVSPGQFGNWAPGRAYWCPGLPVAPIRLDLTPYVELGADNELVYNATLAGQTPRGGNIALSSYVVWYGE